jgi:hypothetical protein
VNATAALIAVLLAAEPVNLKVGDPAPFAGALCDAECAAAIARKRALCEEENRRLTEALTVAPPQTTTPQGYVIAGLVGVLVGVLATGAVIAYATSRK